MKLNVSALKSVRTLSFAAIRGDVSRLTLKMDAEPQVKSLDAYHLHIVAEYLYKSKGENEQ